jgi:hypothetical protein
MGILLLFDVFKISVSYAILRDVHSSRPVRIRPLARHGRLITELSSQRHEYYLYQLHGKIDQQAPKYQSQ